MRTPARASLLVASLAACAAPPEEVEPAEQPYAWDYAPGGEGTAPTVETLTAHLQDVVDRVREFHALPVIAGYQAAMREQAAGCPTYYGMGEYQYWYDDCRTEGGAHFNGYTFFQQPAGTPDFIRTGLTLWGSSTVTTADGKVLHVGGRLEEVHSFGQDQHAWNSRAKGTFRWDGEEAVDTWLAEGFDLDLEMSAQTFADGSLGRAIQLAGGIDGFGQPFDTVRFEELHLTDPGEPLADGCVLEPSGTIALRDEAGAWYEVTFDAVQGGETAPEAAQCDGCGALRHGADELGQVCLDFTSLTAWDETGPW